MKTLLVGFILWSGFAHAEISGLTVRDFNFNYNNPHGEGSAATFSRQSGLIDDGVLVSVDRIDKDFKIQALGAETHDLEINDAPTFMTEAETMSITGLNINLNDNLNVDLTSARFNSAKDNLKLDGFILNCKRDTVPQEISDQLIAGCIQKMTLKTAKFSSTQEKLVKLFSAENGWKSSLGISSLNFTTNAGKFELSAEVKAQVSGKAKGYGNLSYDAATEKLTIKISEVKFGILNVTDQVFDQLKKQQNEKLTVKVPFVYYSLK
jgi:hypothetical protein